MSVVTVAEINEFLERDFPGNGNRCDGVGDGWAVALLRTDAVNLRPGGIISGPTVFGACDAALYYACFTRIGIEPMTLTNSPASMVSVTPSRARFSNGVPRPKVTARSSTLIMRRPHPS